MLDFLKKMLKKTGRAKKMLALHKKYYVDDEKINLLFSELRVLGECSALDIGSGPKPRNPFNATTSFGADIRANEPCNVVYSDLTTGKLPFENDYFEYVTAFDVLEHIPRVVQVDNKTAFPFVLLMNEIFRVLKPGGIFFNYQPCYPAKEAFQDPTHVNIMTEDTLELYFCQRAWARIYGYEGSFTLLEDGWVGGKYFSFLKKSHDRSIRNLEFIQE